MRVIERLGMGFGPPRPAKFASCRVVLNAADCCCQRQLKFPHFAG